jgi:hypothetical protein
VPIPAVVPVPPPSPVGASQRPTISITGGDGRFWDLSNLEGPVILQPGFTGFDMPHVTLFTDGTPGLAGSSWQGGHDDVRTVFLPVYTEGLTRSSAVNVRRDFLRSVHWSRGTSTICVAEADGNRRYLDCVYAGGAEGSEGQGDSGLQWATYGANFQAIDNPYWYGDPITPTSWVVPAPRPFFPLKPGLFTLSASAVLGDTTVDNFGDVEAFPTWTLAGPATQLTLTRDGRTFRINATLLAGETLTIDTNKKRQTVVDGTGVNRWGDVAIGAIDLWPLEPGINELNVAVAGGVGGATSLTMSYQPRFLKS